MRLTWRTAVRIVVSMGTTIKITGAIDRHEPDPSAPTTPGIAWIGMTYAEWMHDGARRTAAAAILKVATGGAPPIAGWGTNILSLRWIGDMPSPEIAQAVYDAIRDRGSARGSIAMSVESAQASAGSPSYHALRSSAYL